MSHIHFLNRPYLCIGLISLMFTTSPIYVRAQTREHIDTLARMTVWDCIRYAVSHSHGLRQRELLLDNAEAIRLQN